MKWLPIHPGKTFVFLLLMSLIYSCYPKHLRNSPKNVKQYIFLGHIYDWNAKSGNRVDPRIEKIDFKQFDQIWLGGDLCSATTIKKSTLDYLDDLFDLGSPNTHWSVGNHDFRNENLHFITDKTHRKLYSSDYSDSLTVIVMNSMMEHSFFNDSCDYKARQLEFLYDALDHLKPSTHLVLLMHSILWDDIQNPPLMEARASANASGSWMDLLCSNHAKFRETLYPRLEQIQANGTQVIIITGDGGQYDKGYYYQAPDGMEFYISGINNSFDFSKNEQREKPFNTDPDSILIFTHNLKKGTLQGAFVQLNSFINN